MKQYFWMILFLIWSGYVYCQNEEIDNLVALSEPGNMDTTRIHALFDLTWHYSMKDPSFARIYNDSAQVIANRLDNPAYKNRIRYYAGVINKNEGNQEEALHFFEEYIEHIEPGEDYDFSHANALFQIGVVFSHFGDLENSLRVTLQALQKYERINHISSIATTQNLLGNLYRRLKKYEKAKKAYESSFQIKEELGDKEGMAIAYGNLGNLMTEQKQYEKALTFYQLALKLDTENNDQWGIGYDLENMGSLNVELMQYSIAEDQLQRALKIREKIGAKREIAVNHNKLGRVYSEMNQSSKAIGYFQKALDIGTNALTIPVIQEAYQGLSQSYAKLGDFQKAYGYQQEFIIVKDSMMNDQISRQILEMDAKYTRTKNEKEIAELNLTNQAKDLQLLRANRQQAYFIFGLVLLIMSAGFLFYLYGMKKKSNLELGRKNKIIGQALVEKETLLKEIHHRVKNNLQIISSLLSLQSRHINDPTALDAIKEGRDRVKTMALIHQNLYQEDNLVGVNIQDYLSKLSKNLIRSYQMHDGNIDLETDIDEMNLDVDTVIPLGLIVNELLTNALKYAFINREGGKIALKLKKENDSIFLQVADNGIGIQEALNFQNPKSMGFRLIKAFSDKMKGDLQVHNNAGTVVSLRIKQYKDAG